MATGAAPVSAAMTTREISYMRVILGTKEAPPSRLIHLEGVLRTATESFPRSLTGPGIRRLPICAVTGLGTRIIVRIAIWLPGQRGIPYTIHRLVSVSALLI